jgi:tetraacyldisaccharide 4'-kinase
MHISGFKQLSGKQQLSPDEFVARCANQTLAAYAGIGAPERFFSDLRALGLRLAFTTALPDHHLFNSATLHAPEADVVIITSKDAVKCNALSDSKIWIAQAHLTLSDPHFDAWLDERLSHIQTVLP